MRSFLGRFERHLKPVFWLASAGTVAMWAIACSSSSSDGSNFGDGGSLSGDDAYPQGDGALPDAGGGDAHIACEYAPIDNTTGCPATYSHSYQDQPCAPVGLQCGYPGVGDEEPNGCFATAVLMCHGDGGITDNDAGTLADGGDAGREGTWTAAQ